VLDSPATFEITKRSSALQVFCLDRLIAISKGVNAIKHRFYWAILVQTFCDSSSPKLQGNLLAAFHRLMVKSPLGNQFSHFDFVFCLGFVPWMNA
jgi:hypothetical protein